MTTLITKGEYKPFEPLPDNVYLAKLTKVVEKAPPTEHPDWFPSLAWTFDILTPPFAKRKAFGKTPTNWINGKKLDSWLVALGINVEKGTSLKIEDLKDLPVKILVKNRKYQDKETGEDKYFPEVKELLSLDSLDQIKIKELAGVPVMASQPPVPQQPVQQPTITPPSQVFAGGYIPVTTSAPAPNVVPGPVTAPMTFPPQPTFTPAPNVTGTPSRTIPF